MTTAPWREQIHPLNGRPRVRPRPQVVVMGVLFAAGFPVRFAIQGASASLFDVVLVAALIPVLLVLGVRGFPRIPSPFLVLAWVSIGLSVASLGWSKDQDATVDYIASSLEAFLVLLVVVTLLRDAPPKQIVNLISASVLLLLIPSALLWLKVPGFLPPSELSETSGDYISYFARLSHPFIGRSNNLAALLVIFIVPLAMWAFKMKHVLAGIAAFVALAAVLLTVSRGTLLALALSVVLYLFIDNRSAKRLMKKLVVPLVFAGCVAAVILSLNAATVAHFASRFTAAGIDARNVLLSDATRIIGTYWTAGLGAGVGPDVHNTVVQQVVYFGLVAGVIVSILLIRVMTAWFGKRHRGEMRWATHAIGIGFVAQLISFLFESSYEGTLLRPLIWLGWGLLIAWRNSYEADGVDLGIAAPKGAKLYTRY